MGKHRALESPPRSGTLPIALKAPGMLQLSPFNQDGLSDLSFFEKQDDLLDGHASESGVMERRKKQKDKGRTGGRRHSLGCRATTMGDNSSRAARAVTKKTIRRHKSDDGSGGKVTRQTQPSRSKSSTDPLPTSKRQTAIDPKRHDRGYAKSASPARAGLKRQPSTRQLKRSTNATPSRHKRKNSSDDQNSHTSSTKTNSSQGSRADDRPENFNFSLSNFIVRGSANGSGTTTKEVDTDSTIRTDPSPSDLVAKALEACSAAATAAGLAANALSSEGKDPALASAMAAIAASCAASASATASIKVSLDSKHQQQ